MSTELGAAEREGRYGFRRARRGPSVGHGLFGRVNSAECPGAQPTPTRPLPSLLHTAIYPSPCGLPRVQRPGFEKRHLSLFHPASFASFAQIARRLPPSALSSSAASSASSSSLHATWLFFPALPSPFYIQPAHPVGLPRHVLIATARTARVRCRAVSDCVYDGPQSSHSHPSLFYVSHSTPPVSLDTPHTPHLISRTSPLSLDIHTSHEEVTHTGASPVTVNTHSKKTCLVTRQVNGLWGQPG